MRKFFLLTFVFFSFLSSNAQNLSFTCARDTILGCGINCFNLNAKFPDIKSLGTDYTLKNTSTTSACLPYLSPGAPGPSANLTIDDRYSAVIPLPFTFLFYGVPYTSLIVSTNGYVSFDVSKAVAFSHYTNNGDLPNTAYDRALIMGPYHDLDPSEPTSPTQQIKYQTFGSAPNRKWVLSFFKVPLFGSSCTGLINNTHQIILHESTGIVEVDIIDKQICTGWQAGKGMVGMQDFNRVKGIMAPNRRMSDPPWGSIGMNEIWRFIPTGGLPLYRSVELLDGSGATIATGDTTRVDANTFEWTFPNICAPSNVTSIYVVKTTYAKIDDPLTTIFSLDTIRVVANAMNASASSVNNTCGASVGSITATATGGTLPLTYILNPGAVTNTTGSFTGLTGGIYTVLITDASGVCSNTLTVTVGTTSNLSATVTSTNTSCPAVNNGSVTVTPTSGTGPYTYSSNGGPSQPSGTFINLAAGTYNIVFTDALGCSGSVTRIITAGTNISGTSTSTATSCSGAADGTITVTASAGVGPYTYSLNGGAFQAGNVFNGVAAGTHSIVIQDSRGCTVTITRTVTAGSSLIGSIFSTATSCPGVNNGTVTLVPTNGTAPYTYRIDGGPLQPGGTFTGVSGGLHTVIFTDVNGCSGSRSITVGGGTALTASASSSNTSCPGVSDGTATITAGGTAPHNYVLTGPGGPYTQTSPIFTGLASGTYSLTFTDFNGCTGTIASIVVTAGPAPSGAATATATSCPTVNDGRITVTNPSGPGITYTLNPGAISNSTGIFTGLAPNTYTISFVSAAGCTGVVTPNPVITQGPFLTSTFVAANPPCANINDGMVTITPTTGTGPYSFTVNPGAVTNTTGVFSNLSPNINYTYNFTDAGGCTGTGAFSLTTNTPIMTPATLTMPLCNGNANGSATFNPFGGVAPYQYSANAGATFQASNSFTGLVSGPHIFRIRDNVGCIKDTTIILTQPTVLNNTAANTTTAGCSNNDGVVTASAGGGTAPYAYSIAGPTVNTTGATSGIFTGLASGNYTVTATDANACTANATATVVLVDNMFLSLGPDTTICAESSVTFNPLTNPETSIFTWRSLNAPMSTINNPAIKNAIASPIDTSIYILNARWGGCVREDTIKVNLLHKPIANAGKDTAICNISYAILRGSASNLSGTVNYAWTPAANVEFPTQATTRVYPPGNNITYTYTLTVKDNYGCNFSVTDQVDVRVQPPVPAYAGNDTIAVKGLPHQLFGSGGQSYLWSPASTLNSPFNQNPLANLQNDTKFVLRVTDVAGCIGYDTVFLKVYNGPTYYVPNAFSPNGDGLNDIFRAVPVGIEKTEWFRIFNRYGELVFQTNQWLKGWDGTYRGKKQPMGAYIWVIKGIDKDGKNVEMKGTVMLLQ